jgi:16S rRNA (uracil1498-N3)-methyltransferase
VEEINGRQIVLTGENAAHIAKSLRMRPGEILTLSDANGVDCEGEITAVSAESVTVQVLETRLNISEPTVSVTLYQALPKVGKFETIVQKAVELGVERIVPVLTSRCVSRPDEKSMRKKLERYNRVALEAAKQSGRGIIPVVDPLKTYEGILNDFTEYDKVILFYEEGGERLDKILPTSVKKVAIIIGSEGGFSKNEVEKAVLAGASVGTLGPRILRCETAPVAALAILMYYTGNM